jgi:hypothetical protein
MLSINWGYCARIHMTKQHIIKKAEKEAAEDEEFFTKTKVGRPKHHNLLILLKKKQISKSLKSKII